MLAFIYFCVVCTALPYLHTVSALPISSMDLDSDNSALSDAIIVERVGLSSPHLWGHSLLVDDGESDDDERIYDERQVEKRRARLHHGGRAGFTIAFPALIRTRR